MGYGLIDRQHTACKEQRQLLLQLEAQRPLPLPRLQLLHAPSDLAQGQHAQVELASRPLLKPVHHLRLRFAARSSEITWVSIREPSAIAGFVVLNTRYRA